MNQQNSEPFDEEGRIEYDRVLNWLSHFGIDEPVTMHCSGHLAGSEIQDLIERAQPEIVVPIHTERSDHGLAQGRENPRAE